MDTSAALTKLKRICPIAMGGAAPTDFAAAACFRKIKHLRLSDPTDFISLSQRDAEAWRSDAA